MKEPAHTVTQVQKAVIYCRVSSSRQKEEGHGLESQEHRCRQHAEAKGYEVEETFPDDVSGGGDFMKRSGMVALLNYLDAQPHKRYVVIFDDLKRFARDRDFHFKLRRAFKQRGAIVECLNYKFEDSPEGEFVETVFAAQGQLERQQHARQVEQKMRARVENGFYCFGPMLGYSYGEHSDGGSILKPDEFAPIVKEALEGFASGRFQTATEVKRFLESHPAVLQKRPGHKHLQAAFKLLRRPIYAGYITIEKWGLHLVPGKHEPLISFDTWQNIQDRLDGNANAPARKDIRADFPLRGFVTCSCCGNAMTAAWSKGRSTLYPYYFCQTRNCPDRRKNIRKEKIEGEFEALLKDLRPSAQSFKLVRAMMQDCWETFRQTAVQSASEAKAQIREIERKTDALVERILATDSPALVTAYETQVQKLETQKVNLTEKAAKAGEPLASFDSMYRTACAFLANPRKLWDSGQFECRRTVLRLVFPGRVAYCPNSGYRTAEIAEPFRLLRAFSGRKDVLVEPRGVEPLTSTMPL